MSDNVITVRHNFPQVAAMLERMGADMGNKAMVRALNKTVDQGKTEMARGISKEFRISVGTAKDRLSVIPAINKNGVMRFEAKLEATKRGQGRAMNLIAFVETSISMAQARKRIKAGEGGSHALANGGRSAHAVQLRFQIKRSGGQKMKPGAFIGNDGRTVFIREGKGRLPIKALNTIDVPQMFNARRINSVVKAVMLNRFQSNFNREARSVIKGYIK
jgi:hypothetical protein